MVLHNLGLMTIREHNAMVDSSVIETNKRINTELEKRSMLVDETLMEIAKWQFDGGDLASERLGVKVILDVPRSLVLGLARAEPEVAQFCLHRVAYLLKGGIQKVINSIMGQQTSDGESQAGSYL